MKSSINILADYREAPFEHEVLLNCPEEYIQKQFRHLTRSLKQTLSVPVIERGDVAILSLESEIPKYNRPTVPVAVGGGIFDSELEEQLIGHRTGENFLLEVQSHPVQVTVKQITRTLFPEPTDAMAAAYAAEHEEYEGIVTVEDYRRYVTEKYYEEQKSNAVYNTMESIVNYVLTHSDWNFDEDELSDMEEEQKSEIRKEMREENGKDFESLTEAELKGYYEVETYEELDHMIRCSCEQLIATALWLAHIYGKDAGSVSLDDLLSLEWDFLENYVKENLNIKEES